MTTPNAGPATATAGPVDCETAVRRLWDYLDGRLPTGPRDEVEAHLATCAVCPLRAVTPGSERSGYRRARHARARPRAACGASCSARAASAGTSAGCSRAPVIASPSSPAGTISRRSARGLELRTPGEPPVLARVDATDDPGSLPNADLVLVAVKSYSLDEVAPAAARLAAGGATVLPLLNGVDAADRLVALGVPPRAMLPGVTFISAAKLAPGVVGRRSALSSAGSTRPTVTIPPPRASCKRSATPASTRATRRTSTSSSGPS